MADPARARRLAKRVVAIVATELQHQVKDPRLAMVTITAAKVTPDLQDATVYYTVLGDEASLSDAAVALTRAAGVLRTAVGRQTGIKFTPTLTFLPDQVPEQRRHIEELLLAARAADAAVARRAADASFAGDPDPYRLPRAADPDTDQDTDQDTDPDTDHAGVHGAAGDFDSDGGQHLRQAAADSAVGDQTAGGS